MVVKESGIFTFAWLKSSLLYVRRSVEKMHQSLTTTALQQIIELYEQFSLLLVENQKQLI